MSTQMFEVIERLQELRYDLSKEEGIELISFNLQNLIDNLEQEREQDEVEMINYYEQVHPEYFNTNLVSPIGIRGLQWLI